MKKEAKFQDVEDKSGIYKITCIANKEFYIGSALRLRNRWGLHIRDLRNKKHVNVHLQNIYNKYGESCLKFELLIYCEKELLISSEQEYIDTLQPTINICRKAGSSLGVKHRPESIEKMRGRIVSEETREKMRQRTCSEETKAKLSTYRKGMESPRKGATVSEETKEKMRLANIGKKYTKEINLKKGRKLEKHNAYGKGRAVIQYTINGDYIAEFVSADQAANNLSVRFGGSNIRKCCDKKIPKAYGYKWKYTV